MALSDESARTLARLLRDDRLARDFVLPLAVAVEELAVTAGEVAAGRPAPFASDRRSLMRDLDTTIDAVAPQLGKLLRGELGQIRGSVIGRGKAALGNPTGAATTLQIAEATAVTLRSRDAVTAAWADVVALAAGASLERCRHAVADLRSLVVRRGHDWSWKGNEIAGLVRRGALDRAAAAAAADPPADISIAWLAFAEAHLPNGYHRIGPVQLFGDQFELEQLRDEVIVGVAEFEAPLELTDEAIDSYFKPIQAEHYVLARVELSGPRAASAASSLGAPPLEWARRFVTDLVHAATFQTGEPPWRLLAGGCYFTANGESAGAVGFEDPRQFEAIVGYRPPTHSRAYAGLVEMPEEFAERLAGGDRDAQFATAEVRWHNSVSAVDNPAMRLTLRIRGFERMWPNRADTWQDSAEGYLRDHWVVDQLSDRVFDAAYEIHNAHRYGVRNPELDAAAHEAMTEIRGGVQANLAATVRHAPLVVGRFPARSLARLTLQGVVRRTRDGGTEAAWIEQLRGQFGILLGRSARLRNRVVHGGEVVSEMTESVDSFISRMSSYLAAQAVDAAARGYELDGRLADAAADLAADLARIGPERLTDVLFTGVQ